MPQTDVLVIGSGIAGLSFAIKMATSFPELTVTIITKSGDSESNTKYAQGGIAVVLDELKDSFDKHIADTLRAGDGLCDRDIVESVIKEGPQRLEEIMSWGVSFDVDDAGNLALGREGGHTAERIIHYKDITGWQIEKSLLHHVSRLPNIKVLPHHFSLDLITEHQFKQKIVRPQPGITCYGAYVMDQQTCKIEKFLSKVTVLATGGCGQVYRTTTNPTIATGDGVAMAYRAMASVKEMEFIQFHPTAFYSVDDNPAFLITEAIRGFGAYLRNKSGERFMFRYDERAELASRDIVAQAIDNELITSGNECVFLDCTHLNKDELIAKFPNIYEKCLEKGIDITKQLIPVAPAAHYQCGGIEVDKAGRTTLNNLYACGECARTGLHGANRLASNSLLEAIVYADRCYKDIKDRIASIEMATDIPDWDAVGTLVPREQILITHNQKELRSLMSDYVAIVRSNERLERSLKRVDLMYHETEKLYDKAVLSPQLCELRNLITIAFLIIRQSIQRKENRGGFYNVDLVQ
ncbi:L-aspartate oxidase [Pseudochryseolinea flava]|uniref:L-aspartate oxidase n=1 Tax=Pseudochryseolinea flava TaxID=2059302 RepID=A0A364XZL4_9BACT|nr:L-aspartate oxidase [Pseudochryseolinea flava]RAV99223.1 L-aspartate oxidase [Pseudochryseolinea flava]